MTAEFVGPVRADATRSVVPPWHATPDLSAGLVQYAVAGIGTFLVGPDRSCPRLRDLADEVYLLDRGGRPLVVPARAGGGSELLHVQYGVGDPGDDRNRTEVPVIHRVRLGGGSTFSADQVDSPGPWWLRVHRFAATLDKVGRDVPAATRRRAAQIIAALVADYLSRDDIEAIRLAHARAHARGRLARAAEHIAHLQNAIAARELLLCRVMSYRDTQRIHLLDVNALPVAAQTLDRSVL